MQYNFEWDRNKALSNKTKHNVSFEESSSIFKDSNMISLYDDEHSGSEDRWISIGISTLGKVIVLSHTFIEFSNGNNSIRIISARKANRQEINQYRSI